MTLVSNYKHFLKSALIVEAWDLDIGDPDDKIDQFDFTIHAPLSIFNESNSVTEVGKIGIGTLTLSYGNLTIDPISCPAAAQPSSTSNSFISQGKVEKLFVLIPVNFVH